MTGNWNPLNAPEVRALPALRKAASVLGLNVRVMEVSAPEQFEPAFDRLRARRPGFAEAGSLMSYSFSLVDGALWAGSLAAPRCSTPSRRSSGASRPRVPPGRSGPRWSTAATSR